MTTRSTQPPRRVSTMKTALLISLVALAATVNAAEGNLSLKLGGGLSLDLVLVHKGSFQQGSPGTDHPADETSREVTLTQDFYLGKTAVTRGQFARFVTETGYRTEAERGPSGGFGWDGASLVQNRQYNWRNPGFPQGDDHPVTGVTYDDAQAFCKWLTGKSGRPIRLPTEAQWEYACRAGTDTTWHNGNDSARAAEITWFSPTANNSTHPVCSLKPNAWGLFIGGNVNEWCRDWYAPYSAGPVTDPEQTNPNLSDKPRRVLRGGSWLHEATHTRSAARNRNTPGSRNADNGFRVSSTATTAAAATAAEAVPLIAPADRTQSTAPSSSQPTPTKPVSSSSTAPVKLTSPIKPEDSESFGYGLLGCFTILGCPLSIIVIVVLLVKALRPKSVVPGVSGLTGAGGSLAPNITTRIAQDGFWLHSNTLDIGSMIYYHYLINGQRQTGNIIFNPGAEGQFVYTGTQPESVDVVNVTAPNSTENPLQSNLTDNYGTGSILPPTLPHSGSSHHSSGYPSAY